MATVSAPNKPEQTNTPTKTKQIRVARRSPAYWRVTIDNPPIFSRSMGSLRLEAVFR
jgi:hypothetical protein